MFGSLELEHFHENDGLPIDFFSVVFMGIGIQLEINDSGRYIPIVSPIAFVDRCTVT